MARTEFSTSLTTIYENGIAAASNDYARDGARIVSEYNIPIQTLRMLPRYGLIELIKRAEQLSYSNLSYEERKLRIQSWAGITPPYLQSEISREEYANRLSEKAYEMTRYYDRFCGIILTGSYADPWKSPRRSYGKNKGSDLDLFLIISGSGLPSDKDKLARLFLGEIEKIHPNTYITIAYEKEYEEFAQSVVDTTNHTASPFRSMQFYMEQNYSVDYALLGISSRGGMLTFGERLNRTEIPHLISKFPPAYPEIPIYSNPPTSQEWELMKANGYQPLNLIDLIEQKLSGR